MENSEQTRHVRETIMLKKMAMAPSLLMALSAPAAADTPGQSDAAELTSQRNS
jgi:hypothetical protein